MFSINIENTDVLRESQINRIKATLGFWNREGKAIHQANADGVLGSPETQKIAQNNNVQVFCLHMVAIDCNNILESDKEFTAGRSGSHVWIHCNDERIAIITFNEDPEGIYYDSSSNAAYFVRDVQNYKGSKVAICSSVDVFNSKLMHINKDYILISCEDLMKLSHSGNYKESDINWF